MKIFFTTSAWLIFVLQSHAAIVFTDIPDESHSTFDITFYDFDHNGVNDLRLESRIIDFGLRAPPSTRVGGVSASPPNSNSFSTPFEMGSFIGADLPDGLAWNSGYSGILSCADIGCIGFWALHVGEYLAVEFEVDSAIHYAWIQLDVPFGFAGGTVRSFAYESEPGRPIIAGAIPEPCAAVMLMLSAGLLVVSRSRFR